MFSNNRVIFEFTGPMGVRVQIGQSLGMLLVFLVVLTGGDLVGSAIFAALLVLAIFLHELGHAWGCIVQGIPVRRVMLHGGGGFCERAQSASPHQEELIVAMGPIVNLALWAIAALVQGMMWENMDSNPSVLMLEVSYYIGVFAFLNLALFCFNMIPVQPLDGGKLLHLALLRFLRARTAHQVAGFIGLVLSVAWIPAMIFICVSLGWILFFIPSIPAHYRMARGQLA